MRLSILFLIAFASAKAQPFGAFADSIRVSFKIPELGYAVVSSDSVYMLNVSGVKKVKSNLPAGANDRFRIGSNTKAITGFIAARLVKQNKITWDTKFFTLFPELKKTSKKAHHELTLLNLLSFRAHLYPYTYTYDKPAKDQFKGNESEQRHQFAKYFFGQEPVAPNDTVIFSNLGYIAAGLMLEKASGKNYKELVLELGKELDIAFDFGAPNCKDTLQPWGHDKDLNPELPKDNYKLNWLLPAGNINVSLPGYSKYIQLQLKGLAGQSDLLTKEEFNFLHFGLPSFAVGWFWLKEENGNMVSYNTGNPGTFLTRVLLNKNKNRAFILFANSQTKQTEAAFEILLEEMIKRYAE